MKKALILTAGFGEGHNTAARNLCDALHRTGEATADVVDLFELSYGRLNEIARRAYLTTINNAPFVWEKIYQLFDVDGSVEKNLPAFGRMTQKLRAILEEERPAVVFSTYPLYSFILDRIFARSPELRIPLITIVTDSITINSIWYRAPSDIFIVPNDATAKVMAQAGVAPEKIRADGFPVSLRFKVEPRRKPPSESAGRKLLFMVNFGKKSAPALVGKLLELRYIDLTVTVGRDEDLRAAVEKAAAKAGREVEIIGWSDKLPDLMLESHLLLSKAGGATVQESIAACLPMIISQVVPGQEEGNAKLLLENECGELAETPDKIVQAVEKVFADDARQWRSMSENITKLSRPGAAMDIARFALEYIRAK